MLYLLLGVVALILVLTALNGFKTVNPAALTRQLRTVGGGVALAAALVLGLRGLAAFAAPLGMLGYWLLFGNNQPSWGGMGGSLPGTGPARGSQSSRVVTDTLEMELDHDTGEMRGRVLKGVFAGRPIQRLAPAELALLWRDCQFTDPKSAQIIEAYLDRCHPTWREDMARAENTPGAGGIMTRDEAFEILGLKPGASEEQIRKSHRELMMKLHPDRGGSGYLAAKINEAKDLLVGK